MSGRILRSWAPGSLVVLMPGVSQGPGACCGPVIDQLAASGGAVRVLREDQSGEPGATATPFKEQDAATGVLTSGQKWQQRPVGLDDEFFACHDDLKVSVRLAREYGCSSFGTNVILLTQQVGRCASPDGRPGGAPD
jgi:hypothetical protein